MQPLLWCEAPCLFASNFGVAANLTEADLTAADLIGANLTGAKLAKTRLRNADLTRAHLSRATLAEADLTGATLISATLAEADLTGATLCRADLIWAHFVKANLREANLSKARLLETVFSDTNLTDVRGLETCYHDGPSTLDHRTVMHTAGLSRAFMRACSLPAFVIDSFVDPKFYSCFISYARKDEVFVKRLCADLQDERVGCFLDQVDMRTGTHFPREIEEKIASHDKLLLVLSKWSLKSAWVEREVNITLKLERERGTDIIFPIRIDDVVLTIEEGWAKEIRCARHIQDFTSSYQSGIAQVLQNLTR